MPTRINWLHVKYLEKIEQGGNKFYVSPPIIEPTSLEAWKRVIFLFGQEIHENSKRLVTRETSKGRMLSFLLEAPRMVRN